MNRESRRGFLVAFKKDTKLFKYNFFRAFFSLGNSDDISKLMNGIVDDKVLLKKLETIFFPQSLANLCCNRMRLNLEMTMPVIEELFLNILKVFSAKINRYVALKTQYEVLLFCEKNEEAYVVLKQIEKEICVSIWSCMQTMKLTEKLNGLEEHKKVMSQYLKDTNKNPLIDTLIEFNSDFLEGNTSYIAYQNRVKEFLNSIKDQEAIYQYFNFKLNMEYTFEKKVLPIAMQFESQFSIVDLYECYINYINFINMYDQTPNYIPSFDLQIDDFRLTNNKIVNSFVELKEYLENNANYYRILDMYSKGEYNSFINSITGYLSKYPQDFQAVLLLVKANINSKRKFDSQYKLYVDIYNIYSMNDGLQASVNNIFNYLKDYQGTTWESKLRGFIARKITLINNGEFNYLSSKNDFRISPNFVKNILDDGVKKTFLEMFEELCPVTVHLYSGKIIEVENLIKDDIRSDLFIAENYITCHSFNKAADVLCELKQRLDPNDLYHLERINQKLVNAYIGMQNYLGLITLIVESFLVNENLIRKIELKKIYNLVKDDQLTKKSICFVLFTYICDKNDYKIQRIAYSNFMNINNLNSVADIIRSNQDRRNLIFFLDKICSHHLLKRDYILNSRGREADNIRIEILQYLIEIDASKKKVYYDEIANIAKQKSIRDRIKQINQSRIFVDSENIKKENEDVLRENFNRYLSVKDFNEEILSIDINSKDYIKDLKQIWEDMNEKIKINPSFSQRIIIYKGLLSKITEEFLYNEKYGLNTFLSSRIRHGYCKNQLNSVFRDCNLLSKKEQNDSDEYKINEYWDTVLPPNTFEGDRIKECLSIFTLNIETKIEEIKSKWLSIKYKEENSDAYLDYSNCVNSFLLAERYDIVDFDEFFKEIIDCLWSYTEVLFEKLRARIKTDLMEYFLQELSKLEHEISNIKNITFRCHVNQICMNINLCKSQISGKVDEFSNVFYKRDVDSRNFTMNELVDTCLEICSKLNGNFREIDFSRIVNDNNLYVGRVFPYFVDILNIMINNAMEHSGFDSFSKVQIELLIGLESDREIIERVTSELEKKGINFDPNTFISIKVKNNLSPDIDIASIQTKVENIFSNINCIESLKKYMQSEGGTGLYKLFKTLKYNIYAPYTILYILDEELFEIQLLIGIDGILGEEKNDENIIC